MTGSNTPTEFTRIAPLPAESRNDQTNELLSMAGDYAERNIFTTMVRHPRLYKRWVPYGTAMLHSRLPARDRELLILRTAHRCACSYEWVEHARFVVEVGIAAPELELLQAGPEATGWSQSDQDLIRAVDEFVDEQVLSDSTWLALSGRYTQSLMIELLMVIGHYLALGMTLNSLGVPLES